MIVLSSKYDCCGCETCAQRCSHKAIIMTRDKEGFLYPHINIEQCTNCGLCEQVCPIINQAEQKIPIVAYAAKNNDEKTRLLSSSGGIFTLLAEKIIADGGVIFGAKFDEQWNVVHDYVETIEALADFRGSKYVQSRIGDIYISVEQFLKLGRKVLFSGTPCQIAGLKRFLIKDYQNLVCIDIICHGVPSPLVWQKYIQQLDIDNITHVKFRDKTNSWKNYEVVVNSGTSEIIRETIRQNVFMKLFLSDLCLRPSCANCPAKAGKSHSDITIADYWGIEHVHPEFDDDKGCNLVIVNSEKGKDLFDSIACDKLETDFKRAISYNTSYFKSVAEPKYRKFFFDNFDKYGFSIYNKIPQKIRLTIIRRIVSLAKIVLSKLKNT